MTELSSEEIVGVFLDHVRYLKVKHHVPGRIRIKASWNGAKKLAKSDPKAIETIISSIPGINEYRLNKKALSVIITYDPHTLSFQLWEDIGRLGEYPTNRDGIREQLLDILNKN